MKTVEEKLAEARASGDFCKVPVEHYAAFKAGFVGGYAAAANEVSNLLCNETLPPEEKAWEMRKLQRELMDLALSTIEAGQTGDFRGYIFPDA